MTDSAQAQAERLFQLAADLAPDERSAFLDQNCADPSLRKLVEALLAQHETPETDFLATWHPAASNDAFVFAPGDTIADTYTLHHVLGEGGLGIVWLATQVAPMRRKVALKLIKPGMDSKEILGRFEAERNALAIMNHPSIARVFDAGTTQHGHPFFAMEYVEGVPVTEFCDTECLTTHQRLELLVDICGAVQHAHQRGIIHRDIKPSNILVTLQEGKPVPKIIDFGIAKATSQDLSELTVLTIPGRMIGTPEYMSPEQAEMSGVGVDSTTDIYSLGVVLYELLTGELPFPSRELRQSGPAEIQRKIREVDPPTPSTRISTLGDRSSEVCKLRSTDPRTLRSQLKGDLDWIVMKALEKQRTRRYASASELAADLQRHMRHEPVLAGRPSRIYKMRKFARRNRVAVIAGLIVLLALVGGIIGTGWGLLKASHAAERAGRVSDFLAGVLTPGDWGAVTTVKGLLDRAAARVDEEFADHPAARQNLHLSLGHMYLSHEYLVHAVQQFQLADPQAVLKDPIAAAAVAEVAQSRPGDDPDYRKFIDAGFAALHMAEELVDEGHPELAAARQRLRSVYRTQASRLDEALRDYERECLRLEDQDVQSNAARILQVYAHLAHVNQCMDAARALAAQAVRFSAAGVMDPAGPELARIQAWAGIFDYIGGDPSTGLDRLAKVRKGWGHLPTDSPRRAELQAYHSIALIHDKQWNEAERRLRHAIQILPRYRGPRNSRATTPLLILKWLYDRRGEPGDKQRAAEFRQRFLDATHERGWQNVDAEVWFFFAGERPKLAKALIEFRNLTWHGEVTPIACARMLMAANDLPADDAANVFVGQYLWLYAGHRIRGAPEEPEVVAAAAQWLRGQPLKVYNTPATLRLAELRASAGDRAGLVACLDDTIRAMEAALEKQGRRTSPGLGKLKARRASVPPGSEFDGPRLARHWDKAAARRALRQALADEGAAVQTLNNAAWKVVSAPDHDDATYGDALRCAQRAVDLEEKANRVNTLGVAQYRVREYRTAIATLQRAIGLRGESTPNDLAYIAMAQHALQDERYRETMETLERKMKESRFANDQESRAALAEARRVCGG